MSAYQLTAGGVRREADGALIPNDAANADWQRYLAWVADGNAADPIYEPPLAQAKADAARLVNDQARAERAAHLDDESGWIELERWRQAEAADAAGSPVAADYPLLEQEIPTTGADIAAVATAVLAERDAAQAQIKLIEGERRATLKAISAAATVSAVQAAQAGVMWPGQ